MANEQTIDPSNPRGSAPDPQRPESQGGRAKDNDADGNQGEGNREAARRYDESQQRFVESGRVQQAAKDAAPESAEQAEELRRAEEEGRSRSRGEDPTVPGANAKP